MFDQYAPLLPGVVALHGRWRRDWPAIVSPEGTLSWAAFDRQTNRIANRLIAAGGHRGDRVALIMSNGRAMMEIMLGIMKAGCVVVPLNPSSADSGLQPCWPMLAPLSSSPRRSMRLACPCERREPCRRRDAGDRYANGWQSYTAWLGDIEDTSPTVAIGPDDVCNIIYSSGTTGEPKGIVHTHQTRLHWAHDLALACAITRARGHWWPPDCIRI